MLNKDAFIHSFIHSFVRSVVHSFIHIQAIFGIILMNGSEATEPRMAEQNLPRTTVMRTLIGWMTRIKWIDKIRTEEIRARAGVANISETIREARLRWLVERKTEQDGVTTAWQVERCYTNDKKESAMVSGEKD